MKLIKTLLATAVLSGVWFGAQVNTAEAASLVDGGDDAGIISGIDNLEFEGHFYDIRFLFDFNKDAATDLIDAGIADDNDDIVAFGEAIINTMISLGYTEAKIESDTPNGKNFRNRNKFVLFDSTGNKNNPVFKVGNPNSTGAKINGFTGIWVEATKDDSVSVPEPMTAFGSLAFLAGVVLSRRQQRSA